MLLDKINESFKRHKNNIAIFNGDSSLTYEELNGLSSSLAAKLKAVSPRAPVLVLCDEKLLGVVAIIACVKAGIPYVPVSTKDSVEKILSIAQQTECRVILSDSNASNFCMLLSDKKGEIELFYVDDVDGGEVVEGGGWPSECEDAYILYTSGSTGIPKGVVQKYEYIEHIAELLIDRLSIDSRDRITLLPELTFSASMMDIFSGLLAGASLYSINAGSIGYRELASYIEVHRITIYHSIPSLFRGVSKYTSGLDLSSLRYIYLAGEPLFGTDVRMYQEKYPSHVVLVNGMGCTEYNICSQYYIDSEMNSASAIVPVGKEASGVRISIENMGKYSDPSVGDIVIHSDLLGRYFIGGEHGDAYGVTEDGTKLFRTGDVGKYDEDGNLVHMGRSDHQVKISGKRVNLLEIENVANEMFDYPVAIAVSVVINDVGSIHLFYPSNVEIEEGAVRDYLKQKLSHYMVPSCVYKIDEVPLTHSGKVNRKLLEAYVENVVSPNEEHGRNQEFNTPDNFELYLLSIWKKTLCHNDIDIEDSFFDVGGTSLQAMKVQEEIELHCGVQLTVIDLFKYPTIKEFARYLEQLTKFG